MNDTIEIDGVSRPLLELVNPPGMFPNGQRHESIPSPTKLKLCTKLYPEFSNRRSIRDMFNNVKPKQVAGSSNNGKKKEMSIEVKHGSSSIAPSTSAKIPPPKRARTSSTPQKPAPKRSKSSGQQSLAGFLQSKQPIVNGTNTNTSATTQNTAPSDGVVASSQGSQIQDSQVQDANIVPSSLADIIEEADFIDPVESKEKWGALFTKKRPPKCEHEEECIQLTTKKPGINNGRAFWLCSR
jgi:AP endonuclease-2